MLFICGSKKTKQNKHKNKKYRQLEAVPFNAETEALVNGDCDVDSLQRRPKDFEEEEIVPIGLQKDTDGIKANHTLASSITGMMIKWQLQHLRRVLKINIGEGS